MTASWRTRLFGAACLSAALLLAVPTEAAAHGRLKGSSPQANAHLSAAPTEVRLTFTERAEMALTTVRLLGPQGGVILLEPLVVADSAGLSVMAPIAGALGEGVHTVEWQTAGRDGHPVRGTFQFVIAPGASGIAVAGAASAGAAASHEVTAAPMVHHDPVTQPQGAGFGVESPGYVAIRWIGFVSLVLLIGAVAFRVLVLARVSGQGATHLASMEQRAAMLGLVATGGLAIALVLRLAAQSYAMHGASSWLTPATLWQLLRQTRWGWGWLLQATGAATALVGFWSARRTPDHLTRRGWALAAVGAVVAAVASALSGHAVAVPRLAAVAVASDAIHVLAASSWLGTLAVLLIAGLGATWTQPAASRGAVVAALVNSFSPVALTSAAVVAATGAFAAWLHVGTLTGLWTSRYGIVLLIKLGVLAGVALTGFYNWRRVQPRLGSDTATQSLQRSARVEVAIALVVLLVTAVLVATPPSMDAGM